MKRYSIHYNDRDIFFEIVHRPAVTRRIHLEINKRGDLQVVAPRRMSGRSVRTALQRKAHRVASFLADARSRLQDLPALNYSSGEEHPFMGERYPLEILQRPGQRAKVELSGGQIQVAAAAVDQDRIRKLLLNWYRQQAQSHFAARLAVFSHAAPWVNGPVPTMRLRRMKRTWGSCSSKGVITFNPHLVKAPPECIDYVVAHEICHLREHNHGRAFYALQEQLYPGWREAKKRLGAQGHIYLHM